MTLASEECSENDFRSGAMFRGMVGRMRRMDDLYDMAFVVDGEKYPAHRVVMASASPVLESLLMNGMKETNESEIVLKELQGSTWDATMYYIYTGQLNLDDVEDGIRMLECSKRFQLEYLEEDVVNFLHSILDRTNCWKVLKAGDHFQIPTLIDSALYISGILTDFTLISFAAELGQLPTSFAETLFSKRNLFVRSEFDVVVGLFLWILKQHEQKVGAEKLASAAQLQMEECKPIYPNSSTEAAEKMVEQLLEEASLTRESMIGLNTSEQCESVDNILRHVNVDKLNEIELIAASILFQGERFAQFRERCKVGRSSSLSEHSVSIPSKYRPLRGREDQVFTFSHTVSEGNTESIWFPDITGKQKWKLRSTRNGHVVSVFIATAYNGTYSPRYDETVTFQISVCHDEDLLPCLVCSPMVKEISWFVRKIGKSTIIPQHVIQNSEGNIKVSVTLYWFGSTEGVPRPQPVHWNSL